MAVMTYREALNLALREEMTRDDRVFIIGEEVGLYEGAYKVTQGLLKDFGPKGVVRHADRGIRLHRRGHRDVAMVGLRPVVEMMTFNLRPARPRPDRELGGQDELHVGQLASSTCRS